MQTNCVAVSKHLHMTCAFCGSECVNVYPERDGVLVVVNGFRGACLDALVGEGGVGCENRFGLERGGRGD